jgi:hypothetical protein
VLFDNEKCTEDVLHLIYSSKRFSGGGDIEDLTFDGAKCGALIKFQQEEGICSLRVIKV